MKKQMKRTVSLLLSLILCFTFGVSVQAASTKGYVKSISVVQKATITIPADKKTKTEDYKVTVKVVGNAAKTFTAKSSNTAVATVKVSGSKLKVSAKKAGKATITVTTTAKNEKGQKLSKKLSLTVKKEKGYVNSISVASKGTITIPADANTKTADYNVTVKVTGDAAKTFTAKSSNTDVATVKVSGSKLKVTAKKEGKATVTVTTTAKDKKGRKLSSKLALTVEKADPGPDKREGVITEDKDMKLYYYNPMDPSNPIGYETHTVYFSSAYPGVPFLSDSFVISYFLENYGYDPTDYKVVKDGLDHTYQLPMGTSVNFNYASKTMWFSDYTSTLTVNGDYIPFNPMNPRAEKETTFYSVGERDRYYGGEPILMTFGYDEIPMLQSGVNILIPLQTFSDLFFSYQGNFLSYNGKAIYAIDNNLANDPAKKAYYDQYCDTEKVDTISPALAQVNYYELCNALDLHYGLQAAHNIDSFDAYFERKGIKKRMLSGDLAEIEKATRELGPLLFEDFHSGVGMQSVFLKEPVETDVMSPVYVNRQYNWKRVADKRQEVLGTLGKEEGLPGYERRGDTVFITFDEFRMDPTMASYYAPGYEPTENVKDTVELFAYSLNRLQKEEGVKNVVIDLANNGGGAVYACGYVMQAICGQCNINIQNPTTWALHQCMLNYDLNLDGVKDENDKSLLDLGFNVAVNISDCSFSSGNLLPNALDQLDDRILLIGQKSGGGACVVGYLSTAIGSTMQVSSEHRFVTMKNGYIRDIDGGIAPDVYLSLNRLFDRDYIKGVVEQHFAAAE